MTLALNEFYTTSAEPEVLPALRELLSQYPAMKRSGAETLSRALFVLRFLSHRPDGFAVESALEALYVEGEVLA
jgi:hypothetical protein